MEVFETTPGVVDVDWTVEAPQQTRTFAVDRVTRRAAGASVEQITQTLYLALSGAAPASRRLRTRGRARRSCRGCRWRPLVGRRTAGAAHRHHDGAAAARPLRACRKACARARMRKNLRPVIYVTGDVAGCIESPVYAILDMNRGWTTSA
jgi:hypothetical protein